MPTPHTRRIDRQPATDGALRPHASPNPVAGPIPSALLSFYADRNAEAWEAGEPVRADGRARSVTKAIKQFSPKDVPAEQWARIEGLVRESATKAAPISAYSAKALMTVVTELVIWIDTVGLPLEPAVIFHPDNIDRFAAEGCAHLASGTQNNYRRQLRAVGAAVIGPELFPPPPLALKRSDPLAPYSAGEIAALRSWARGLPTERYRLGLATILAFGLGAGITSQELNRMVGTDVSSDGDGVAVHVIGDRARAVPVLDAWADQVASLARAAGPEPIFLSDRNEISRRQVPNFIAKCPKGDAPTLNVSRLRNTWIIRHLSAGTHLRVLAQAAGVDASQIVKFAPYATFPTAAAAHKMLRDPEPS
jgi:integrase